MTRPGARLRSLAGTVCSQSTMERLIDPVIADLQREYDDAVRDGRPWQRRWTLVAGYVAFWKVVAVMAPGSTVRSLRDWAARDDWAVGRTLGLAALTTAIATALLMIPPLRSVHVRSGLLTPWRLVLLMPQAFPLTVPFGLLVGVLCGLRGRSMTNRVRRAIVILGLIGSTAMFGTIAWLVPAANQAFRVSIAGRDISRGTAETPLPTLRERALELKRNGRPEAAQAVLLSYHTRWSLSAAAFAFALFGLSLIALRLGRAGTVVAGAAAPLVYMTYLWELTALPAPSSEGAVIVAAWLPTVMLILVSVALLSLRSRFLKMSPLPS